MGEQAIRQNPAGWWLPDFDNYFAQFMTGVDGKSNGFMREHLLEAFRHVRDWNVAVDVGAHVGFWVTDMARRFKDVYAFEAMSQNYECLVKNVAEFDNVHTFRMAVGDTQTACKTFRDELRPHNSGSFYIQPDPYGDIPMVTLNQMRLPGCDLLKIDVEGFELKVLHGASKVIKGCRPVVIMECTDKKFRGRYDDIPPDEAQKWLLRHGYKEAAHMRPDKIFVPL